MDRGKKARKSSYEFGKIKIYWAELDNVTPEGFKIKYRQKKELLLRIYP